MKNHVGNPKFFYGYIVVTAACLILTITQGTFYSFGVFLKPLSADFGWTRTVTSGAVSLCTILHGFLFIFTGKMNDSLGPRLVMTGCGLFLGLGYLLMSQVSAIWQLYLFYGVVIAIGMSGGFIPMVSTVARWFVKRRGLMTGLVAAGTGLGTLIVPPIANLLISNYDWSISYVIIGISSLVIIVLAAQFLRRDPHQAGQSPYGAGETKLKNSNLQLDGFSFGKAIRTIQFRLFAVANLCFGFCIMGIMTHIVPHATDIGVPAAEAAAIIATIGGAGIVGRIVMGSAGDRVGNKEVFAICFVLLSGTLALLLLAEEAWMFYLFGTVFGFAYGGIVTLFSPLVADLFGLRSHGALLGSTTFVATVGGAISPVLGGSIFDVTGSYQLFFVISIVASVLALTTVLLLKPAK